MEKILVLGGTGNIGFPLITELAKSDNVTIIAGVHQPTTEAAKFQDFKNVTVSKFDFLDAGTFAGVLAGVDRVFFVRPPQLAKPKVDMFPFLDQVKASQVKHIVFVSLIGVEKNPMTPHHKIEQQILKLGIPHTFIRPSFFMQNLNTTHLVDIRDHHTLFVPAGHSKTSFIDTRDIGAVAAKCLLSTEYINTELEITGEKALTYTEIAGIMSKILGTAIDYSQPSLLRFRKTMLKRGLKKEYVNVMVMLYLITQLGNANKTTTTLEQVLGRPATSFEQYVTDYKAVFTGQTRI
ncbi:NmrA family NAD(P)-binding protein [Loigolactobacillus jiayinensis]|uniref:NmrA family NAD(P)-binding protein n=1 Tax=Loigolactobacillus jiayinensis TaxID=2486016 RepID=A0ABW1RKM6_9LACO|nr:NmrA family NAD(P)-binding protein [Loigolactobacillus jiayinensis]